MSSLGIEIFPKSRAGYAAQQESFVESLRREIATIFNQFCQTQQFELSCWFP
jgi:hypothetical protein